MTPVVLAMELRTPDLSPVRVNGKVYWAHSGNSDVLLRLGSYQHVCGSYYFGFDPAYADIERTGGKLALFLDTWIPYVEALRYLPGTPEKTFDFSPHPGVAMLPFDFFDEDTAWLRVSIEDGETLTITAGWGGMMGAMVLPSDFEEHSATALNRFRPISKAAPVTCRVDDLITAIAASRDHLAVSHR